MTDNSNKYKTLKNKLTGDYGIMMDKKIISVPVPLLIPMYVTWKQISEENLENLDQYKLVTVVVKEIV